MGGLLLKKDKPGKPKYLAELKPLSDFEEIPIPAYQFSIEIGSVTAALFQACKNLEVTREVEKLTEGGLNAYTYLPFLWRMYS